MKAKYKKFCMIAFAAVASVITGNARELTVQGTVVNVEGEPLQGVTIYNPLTDHLLAVTNEEGKYHVNIDSEGKLLFTLLGMEDLEVPVNGQQTIDPTLIHSAVTLEEVVVKGKSNLKVVAPEESDIEIRGNYAYIKTRVKVPGRLFDSDTRLIIQPALYNISESSMWYLKPLVFDGREYAITQDRMHDFRPESDPLNDYRTLNSTKAGRDKIILWSDSVYLSNPDSDFRCDMLMAMEDYNKVFYRDTATIARGVVNPLRFFEFHLDGTEITDSQYFPKPEMQLRDTKGDVMLTFGVNKTRLNMSEGNNQAEMRSLLNQLHEYENNPNVSLKSFTISCTSSPEGNYNHNVELAEGRMASALDVITANLSPATRKHIELKSNTKVDTWEHLIEMLRADGYQSEANDVQDILDRTPNQAERRDYLIRRLPFYQSLIHDVYLPRMRKVSYEYVTSQYRYIEDNEIIEEYKKDPNTLSRYEFYRLFRHQAKNDAEKEKYLTKALEVHPKFMLAAADLSALKLKQGKGDTSILAPFVNPDVDLSSIPAEARLTQVAACLAERKFSLADSLMVDAPDNKLFHKAKVYVDVFNGKFDDAMQEAVAESPLNEVVLLLTVKANDKAWQKAQELGNTPNELYVKAIAANRVDEYMSAVSYLQKAIKLDPSLRDVAKIDGDLIEIIEDIEQSNQSEE